MSTYLFEKPLIRGTMLKRKSQFTASVDINGEELIAHLPTTNRIGDVENKNLPCLLSCHDDPEQRITKEQETASATEQQTKTAATTTERSTETTTLGEHDTPYIPIP